METEISKVGRFVKGEELEKPTSQKLVMAVDQINKLQVVVEKEMGRGEKRGKK